jgi:hypothetical protein
MPLFFGTIKKEGSKNMGLDYDYPDDGSKACEKKPMKVSYSGKTFGDIKKVKDGYQFTGANSNLKRGVFPSIGAVQNDLLACQPGHTPFQVKKDSPSDEDHKRLMAQLEKVEKKLQERTKAVDELSGMEPMLDRANVLLSAALELMGKQKDSKTVLNILEQTATYDDNECDGFCLIDDIVDHLGT